MSSLNSLTMASPPDGENSEYQGLKVKAQELIENEQTPLFCMVYDKTLGKVVILSDSESVKKVREVQALVEVEDILKRTFEEGKKLSMLDQNCLSCENMRSGGLSHHTCHELKPQYQLSWEKNLQVQECFEDRTSTDVNYERLPKEVLLSIFKYFEPSDLRSLILVSKSWGSVADEPDLWKEFELPSKCKKSGSKFLEFFQTSISMKLQILSLQSFSFQLNDDHIKKLLSLELKSITIGNIDLFNVSDEYLAQIVNNSKECTIIEYEAKLKTVNGNNINVLGLNKLKAIFRKMEIGTKLKSLVLGCSAGVGKTLDLTFVPSTTLANAFNKLQSLELGRVKLRPNQLKTIFDYMSVKTKLKSLNLNRLNLESVDMKIFDQGFSNLSELILQGLDLSNVQLQQFAENLDRSSQLKTLKFDAMNVEGLSPGLFARVVTKVSYVDLDNVKTTANQLEQIFKTISVGSSVIKHFNLYEVVGIKEIDPETLAMGINKLDFCDFQGSFTEDQTKAIFKVMSQGTCLKRLGTSFDPMPLEWINHVKQVDPELLASAVHNLEEVKLDLEDSHLTLAQYIAVFKKFGHKSKIKKLSSQVEVVYL